MSGGVGYSIKNVGTPERAEAKRPLLASQKERARLLLEAQKKVDLERAALRGPFPGLHEEVFNELTREERRAIDRASQEGFDAEERASREEALRFHDCHGAEFHAARLWVRACLIEAQSVAYDTFDGHGDDESFDAEAPAVVLPIAQMLARRLVHLTMPAGTAGGGQ